MLTPAEVAKRLGVGYAKVATWIRNGELAAINVAANPHCPRPRYKVSEEALETFKKRRAVIVQPTVRRPREKFPPGFIEYFK